MALLILLAPVRTFDTISLILLLDAVVEASGSLSRIPSAPLWPQLWLGWNIPCPLSLPLQCPQHPAPLSCLRAFSDSPEPPSGAADAPGGQPSTRESWWMKYASFLFFRSSTVWDISHYSSQDPSSSEPVVVKNTLCCHFLRPSFIPHSIPCSWKHFPKELPANVLGALSLWFRLWHLFLSLCFWVKRHCDSHCIRS